MQSGIKANACLETRTDWHALRATPRWCPINSWHHLNFWKKNPQQNVQRVRRSAERTPYPEYTAYTYGKTLLGHSESNQALTLLLLFFLLKNIWSFDCERVSGCVLHAIAQLTSPQHRFATWWQHPFRIQGRQDGPLRGRAWQGQGQRFSKTSLRGLHNFYFWVVANTILQNIQQGLLGLLIKYCRYCRSTHPAHTFFSYYR